MGGRNDSKKPRNNVDCMCESNNDFDFTAINNLNFIYQSNNTFEIPAKNHK